MTRPSTEQDKPAIYDLHRQAFGEAEGETIAQLALDLLDDPTAQPLLSVIAESDGEIVGHVIFTPVKTAAKLDQNGFIMAPLAVIPQHHGKGIATGLIEHGLAMLREQGVGYVLVLGDPGFYTRNGFKAGHGLKPPHPLQYPEAWMALELQPGALKAAKGQVQCSAVLSAPEHW